jgi:hypothetical protein
MVALGRDDLNEAERKRMYDQASLHLGQLLETMMSPALSEKVTECAKRLDEAIALWAADEVERRDGLPPAIKSGGRLYLHGEDDAALAASSIGECDARDDIHRRRRDLRGWVCTR